MVDQPVGGCGIIGIGAILGRVVEIEYTFD
jgi:hypothetical protein